MKKTILKLCLVIVIVLVLSIPVFIFSSMEKTEKNYQELVEKIETAAKSWASTRLIEGETIIIKLGELKDYGLIDYNLKNPKTKGHLSDETYAEVKKLSNNQYQTEIKLYEIPKRETAADLIIQMIGDKELQNGISVRYQELGINVHEGGEQISYSVQYFLKGEEIVSIDTSRPKTYEVVYTALNGKGELAKVVRKVIVQ